MSRIIYTTYMIAVLAILTYTSGLNSPRKSEEKEEEDGEFKQLIRKWKTLTNEDKMNETSDLLPKDWLYPTAQHTVTFNTTHVRNAITEKIESLIQRHQTEDKKRHMKFLKQANRQDPPNQYIKVKDGLMENMRNKAKNVMNRGSQNITNNFGDDKTEYPRQNQTIRSMLFEQWKKYYLCLQNNTEFIPKAHYLFPGESIKMVCQVCLRPGDETRIVWSLATVRTRHKEEIIDVSERKSAFKINNRMAIREGGLALHIYGINDRDAGNYTCRLLKSIMTVHLLQVADSAENLTRVWPANAREKLHAAPEFTLPNFGMKVFTKWKNWTSCSRCAQVGKRFRVGVCTVGAASNSNRNAPQILSLFRDGVPCRSKLLPKSIQEHPNIISRNSEIMESFCKVPCLTEKKFVVRDDKGNIVEEADNSKGVYSMLQKLPDLPSPIRRKILFMRQWDTAHIQCPGNHLNDIPARWFVKNQPIFSKGNRIYVTPSHMLVVEDLGLADSNLYSCWQGGKLVGTVRLVVSQPVRLTFSQQISAISMILVVLTFIVIFGRAFCNALRSTQ